VRISKVSVDALHAGAKTRFYWDDTLKGFGIKVTTHGSKTYVAQYRTSGGRSGQTRRFTIGKHGSPWTPDKAREEAKRILAEAAQGSDPAAIRKQTAQIPTLVEFCDRYLREGTGIKKDSTIATDRGRIERHIKPLLGHRRLDELTPGDLRNFLKQVADGKTATDIRTGPRGRAIVTGGKGTATRTLGLLSGILSYAVALKLIAENPAHGIERFPDQKNERYLTIEEMRLLGNGIRDARSESVNPNALDIIELLIFTGARRGEIERLRWSEVDFVAKQLRLDDSKTGQKQIRLNQPALRVLESRSRQPGSGFVFPSDRSEGYFVGTPRVWSQLRDRVGLPDVRLHDLRHSFASIGVVGGTPLMIVGALLGHTDHMTTQRYAHLSLDPIAAAAEDIGRQIDKALNPNS